MSTEFTSAGLTAGQLNAIVKKLGGHENALRFLRGELAVSEMKKEWRDEEDVIRFTVRSTGDDGVQWASRLERKDFPISRGAREILGSKSGRFTKGLYFDVAVFKARCFGQTSISRLEVLEQSFAWKFDPPTVELACLIRDKFSNTEIRKMGFRSIFVMNSIMVPTSPILSVEAFGSKPSDSGIGICTNENFKGDSASGFAFIQATYHQ